MCIAVTGAAGHLGANLCRRLAGLGEGDLVRIDLRDLPDGPGEARQANLAEPGDAAAALEGADVIVHCAAVHPWRPYTEEQYVDLNIKGTWYVYAAAAGLGVERVILTSSIAAAGYRFTPEAWPISEEMETTPSDIYSFTKHSQEVTARHFASDHGIATIALRPPAFMPKGELETGLSLLGAFCLVDDVVEAHVAALMAKEISSGFEAFFATNRLPYGSQDGDIAGDAWSLVERHYPGVRAWFGDRGLGSLVPWVPAVYSIEKAKTALGWQPRYSFDWWWRENRDRL